MDGDSIRGDVEEGGKPGGRLHVPSEPGDSSKANVEGKQLNRPIDGFGQLWRKTYRLSLRDAATPEEVVALWKERLPELMPEPSRFYPTLKGIETGEVVLITASLPGGVPALTTGVLVLYADNTKFTVATPEGHPESGYNTFSASDEAGVVVAQIQSLVRAGDPVFEFAYRYLGGAKVQEKIWSHVLTELGKHFGVTGKVDKRIELLDQRVQWTKAGNVWHNSAIRSALQFPLRVARRVAGRK
jgi:hypothetical protein